MENEEAANQEVMEARARLAAKFGDGTRTGGKGSQRRKKKTVQKNVVNEDKKLKSAIKKYGVQPLQDIDEVNMFKDDHSVIHFKRPQIQFSVRENLLVVTGVAETKELKELLPDILRQVGPQQKSYLESIASTMGAKGKDPIKEENEDDDDDVPNLVGTNFEEAAKKN